MDRIQKYIGAVADFPQPGIIFRDISPLLAQPSLVEECVVMMKEYFDGLSYDAVAAIDARGFLFGSLLSVMTGKKLLMVQKKGKLPGKTVGVGYEYEYASAYLELQEAGVEAGERVLIVDDVLATGSTVEATVKLVEKAGGEAVGVATLIEIEALEARKRLQEHFASVRVHTLLAY